MTLVNQGRWVDVLGHFLSLPCDTGLTANSNLTDLLLVFLKGAIFLFPLQFFKSLLLQALGKKV